MMPTPTSTRTGSGCCGLYLQFSANPSIKSQKNIESAIFSFEEAIQRKSPIMCDYRYYIPLPRYQSFEERYWTTSNTPVLDDAERSALSVPFTLRRYRFVQSESGEKLR
jgi:hypothetical protein